MFGMSQNRWVWIMIVVATVALYIGRWFNVLPTTDLEIFGFFTGIVCVRMAAQNNIWNWPIGIVNVSAFLILFVPAGLYANVLLQVVYIIQGFWGWYKWAQGQTITYTPRILLGGLALVSLPATLVLTGAFTLLTWQLPVFDTLTAVVSIIANYLLGLKRLENWYLWIAVDVVYIVVFITQGLYLTGVLYLLFLLQCLSAVTQWKRQMVVVA